MEETQHTSTPNKKMVNAKCQSSDHRTEQNRTEQNVLCHNNDLDMYIHVSYKYPKQENG